MITSKKLYKSIEQWNSMQNTTHTHTDRLMSDAGSSEWAVVLVRTVLAEVISSTMSPAPSPTERAVYW